MSDIRGIMLNAIRWRAEEPDTSYAVVKEDVRWLLRHIDRLEAGRAVQDDGLPTVEALAQAMWDALSDNGILRIDADRPKELNDIAATIHRRLRAAPPLPDPEADR